MTGFVVRQGSPGLRIGPEGAVDGNAGQRSELTLPARCAGRPGAPTGRARPGNGSGRRRADGRPAVHLGRVSGWSEALRS